MFITASSSSRKLLPLELNLMILSVLLSHSVIAALRLALSLNLRVMIDGKIRISVDSFGPLEPV